MSRNPDPARDASAEELREAFGIVRAAVSDVMSIEPGGPGVKDEAVAIAKVIEQLKSDQPSLDVG